jgi:S1-C subfamily serine protease
LAIVRLVGLVALVVVVAAGVSYGVNVLTRRDTTPTVSRGPIAQPGQADGPQTAAQRAADSVVRILTGGAASPSPAPSPAPPAGTGAIVDSRGFVLTAETLVAGAASISVVLPSGRTVPALVAGTDVEEGLALLKIDAGSPHALQFGGGAAMDTGSGVAVMAAPPGFQMSVGAVAGAHNSIDFVDPATPGQNRVINDVVALDVTVRDGQLGAPILDGAGRLIGVVVRSSPQLFGVDMTDAQTSVQQLIESGHVSFPSLGFEYRQLTAAESAGRGVPAGVEVLTVATSSPAAAAGLAAGDIVVSAGGTNLDPSHPLIRILRGLSVRQSVALSVKSAGGTKVVSLPLALVSL